MTRLAPRLFLLAVLAALLFLPVPASLAAAGLDRLISLDADDAYLPAVLKILAEKGDLNIVTGPGVTAGKITIHLKDVPVEQAVNLVVRAAGLAYERIGNSVLVADAKSLRDETGLSSYILTLKYADAIDVQTALKGLTENIQVDRGGNRLIVVTSPRVIAEMQAIVAQLDQPARQVMLEARIVEVSSDGLKKLGIDWDQLNRQGTTFIEGNGSVTFEGGTLEEPGGLKTGDIVKGTPGTNDIWKLGDFSRLPKVFRTFVDLLIHDGNAKLLASPKLVTLNGKEATMLSGQRIPYVTNQTVFAGGAAAPTSSVQHEEVGIKLAITPLINADGFITVHIRPEVSSVTGFRGPSADLPVVSTRQAETTVRLKDGATVLIGGLLDDEKTVNITKVPLLGDIPILGKLFRHQNVITTKRDLVIEVTPHLLVDPAK
ncbi:MAG: secretin N-terminal domain-containing protein [Candidatus Eisenbacteria bacterium]